MNNQKIIVNEQKLNKLKMTFKIFYIAYKYTQRIVNFPNKLIGKHLSLFNNFITFKHFQQI